MVEFLRCRVPSASWLVAGWWRSNVPVGSCCTTKIWKKVILQLSKYAVPVRLHTIGRDSTEFWEGFLAAWWRIVHGIGAHLTANTQNCQHARSSFLVTSILTDGSVHFFLTMFFMFFISPILLLESCCRRGHWNPCHFQSWMSVTTGKWLVCCFLGVGFQHIH